MADLKPVYQATSKDEAEQELASLEDKWGKKYPVVIDSWKRNWDKLSTYFQYSAAIRKLIYTTNTIEGFHRQVRKVTKTKGAFTSDMSLLKTDLSGYPEHSEEMDTALAELGFDGIPAIH